MPLPVAHALAGACLATAAWPAEKPRLLQALAVGAVLGALPDADYLLNWVGIFGKGWHHGFTHSLVFALAVGAVAAVAVRLRFRRGWLACSLAALTHPVMDYLLTESRGVALFWPFSDARLKLAFEPLSWYQMDHFSGLGRLGSLAAQSGLELLLLVPLVGAAVAIYRRRAARRD